MADTGNGERNETVDNGMNEGEKDVEDADTTGADPVIQDLGAGGGGGGGGKVI